MQIQKIKSRQELENHQGFAALRERDNPLLNEIFTRYSIRELARALDIKQNTICAWKYIPTRYAEKVACLCDIPVEDILDNTNVCITRYAKFAHDNKIINGSLGQCQQAEDEVNRDLKEGRDLYRALLSCVSDKNKRMELSKLLNCDADVIIKNLKTTYNFIQFMRNTHSIHKTYLKFVFKSIKERSKK